LETAVGRTALVAVAESDASDAVGQNVRRRGGCKARSRAASAHVGPSEAFEIVKAVGLALPDVEAATIRVAC
jgi:hypothetical protein